MSNYQKRFDTFVEEHMNWFPLVNARGYRVWGVPGVGILTQATAEGLLAGLYPNWKKHVSQGTKLKIAERRAAA